MLSVICEAMVSIPWLFRLSTLPHVDAPMVLFMKPVHDGILVFAAVVTPLRAACALVSVMPFELASDLAARLVIVLTVVLASCYIFALALLCSIWMQMVLALWCFIVVVMNVMLAWKFPVGSEESLQPAPLQHTPPEAECSLELDHYNVRLQHWGTACVICLGDFREGEEVARLSCGHSFHEQCIRRWLQQRRGSQQRRGCPYRCSANANEKRKQWEAQELANSATDGGDHEEQLDIITI